MMYAVIPVIPETKRPALPAGFSYSDFHPGIDYRNGDFRQAGIVTSEQCGLAVIDVDKPELWSGSTTEAILGLAVTTRNIQNGHWHIYLDATGYTGPWPSQGPTVWGDLKSNGFVRGEPAYQWCGQAVPLTEEIVAAIDADRIIRQGSPGSGTPNGSMAGDWQDDDYEITSDNQLTADIASMVSNGLTDAEIYDRLDVILHPLTDPWSQAQIQGKVDSARSKGFGRQAEWDAILSQLPKAEPAALDVPVVPQTARSATETAPRRRKWTKGTEGTLRRVDWLWEPYVPQGMLTVLGGMEGSGKTQIAFELAARVTRAGKAVIIVSPEDSRDQVTRPRLIAAGSDMEKIVFFDAMEGDTDVRLATDLGELAECAAETSAALVIFDPIISVLGDGTDANEYGAVSRELGDLCTWADKTGVSVLAITHLRKSSDGTALNKMMGSRAFTSKPRSVLMTASHPDDAEILLLVHAKSNVGRIGVTQGYEIENFQIQRGSEIVATSKVRYSGELEMFTAQTIMEVAKPKRESKAVQCAAFVRRYLEDHGGIAPVAEVKAAAMGEGYGMDILADASLKILAGFHAERRSGFTRDRSQVWALDDEPAVSDQSSVLEALDNHD